MQFQKTAMNAVVSADCEKRTYHTSEVEIEGSKMHEFNAFQVHYNIRDPNTKEALVDRA